MDTYIVTARTIEEAYAIANKKYADEKHEVSCEVLEMPKKGFLGIGSKEAKIKVTVTSSVSADLGSIVADMRGMKKYTDRGDEGHKDQQKQQNNSGKQNNNQKQNNGQQKQNQPKNENKGGKQKQQNGGQQKQNNNQQAQPKSDKQQNNNNRNNQQKNNQRQNNNSNQPKQNNGQPKQNNQPKPAEQKQAQPQQPQKPKSALSNSAKPNVRPQIKLGDDGIDASGITVGKPMGLTDFVSENKQSTFGNGQRSGGSMSNDIRRKKPAKPMMPADKADEKMRASKYDVAESDEDYKNIEAMERENEALLEREAGAALGFGENEAEEAVEIPAAEPRKKEPITQAEMDYALEFANTLLTNMNVDAKAVPCECPEGEDFEVTETANVYPKIEIVGDDTGILIGHHGETLDAIQYLVNLSALRKTKSKDGDYVKIVVDTENYREKRAETLKSLARRMAAKAVKYKRNVFLEPMNAYERRIIHSELQSYPDVSTHSVGSDRDRKIIITYEGADKQTENRSRRRRRGGSRGGQKNEKPALSAESAANIEYAAANAENKVPKKIQKVSIDQLDEVLEGKGNGSII